MQGASPSGIPSIGGLSHFAAAPMDGVRVRDMVGLEERMKGPRYDMFGPCNIVRAYSGY